MDTLLLIERGVNEVSKLFVRCVTSQVQFHNRVLPYGAIYGRSKCGFATNKVAVEVDWFCESLKTYGKANDYYIYIYDNRIEKWVEVNTSYSKGYYPIKSALDKCKANGNMRSHMWHDFREIELPHRRRVAQYI